jgi:DNA-binding beta-propeller fold protein YncE
MRNAQRRRLWWLGLVGAVWLAAAVPAHAAPSSVVCALCGPRPPFAYVAGDAGCVFQFDAAAGGLAPLSPTATRGANGAVAVSPDGTSVYITKPQPGSSSGIQIIGILIGLLLPATQGVRGCGEAPSVGAASSILQYDVGADGSLTLKTPPAVRAGNDTVAIAVTPDGNSVYAVNHGDNQLSEYTVGPGGALTPKTRSLVGAGHGPAAIAVSPDGSSVYVTNSLDGTVSQYTIGAGGELIPKTPRTVSAGRGPVGIAVSPDGKSVYVTNAADSTVSQYDVGAGGKLSAKTPSAVPAGRGPFQLVITPDGRDVYVINAADGTVSRYDVGAGGALSAEIAIPVGGGNTLTGIAVTPDGKSVYITNYSDNPGVDTVSQFDLDANGALTPISPATVPAGTLADAIAVGPATLRFRCAGVINACAVGIAPVNSGVSTNALIIRTTLVRTAPIGILVERLIGKRRVRIGRVPFGLKRTGRLKVLWDLRVGGHRLPAGRYRITLRMFDRHHDLIALAHPVTIAIH